MTVTVAAVKPPHISYSSFADWLKCGKYFQLKRLLGLQERPAMWNAGGHAVHSATEYHDRMVHELTGC